MQISLDENSGVRLLSFSFFSTVWNSPFGKSSFLQSHKCFFLLGFFQVEKMLSEAVAISSQDIFIDPNQRASIKKHRVTLWGYFNYEKCCKQLKESKCLTREKALHSSSLRKHFFTLSKC